MPFEYDPGESQNNIFLPLMKKALVRRVSSYDENISLTKLFYPWWKNPGHASALDAIGLMFMHKNRKICKMQFVTFKC